MVNCSVCGQEYELVVGDAATPGTKSGAYFDRKPHPKGSYIDYPKGKGSIRFFCSQECGKKLKAAILAA